MPVMEQCIYMELFCNVKLSIFYVLSVFLKVKYAYIYLYTLSHTYKNSACTIIWHRTCAIVGTQVIYTHTNPMHNY